MAWRICVFCAKGPILATQAADNLSSILLSAVRGPYGPWPWRRRCLATAWRAARASGPPDQPLATRGVPGDCLSLFWTLTIDPRSISNNASSRCTASAQRRDHCGFCPWPCGVCSPPDPSYEEGGRLAWDPAGRFQNRSRARGQPRRACHNRYRHRPGRCRCSWPDAPGDARRPVSNEIPRPAAWPPNGRA